MKVFVSPSESLKQIIENTDPALLEALPNEEKFVISVANLTKLSKATNCFGENVHIHELLKDSSVILPSLPAYPRNPELDARVKKLEAESSNREYSKMTKNLEPLGNKRVNRSNLGDDMKTLRKQLTLVVNFVLTVGGTFCFTYKALEYSLPEPNIPAQVLLGIISSSVVAAADLYFLLKHDL